MKQTINNCRLAVILVYLSSALIFAGCKKDLNSVSPAVHSLKQKKVNVFPIDRKTLKDTTVIAK